MKKLIRNSIKAKTPTAAKRKPAGSSVGAIMLFVISQTDYIPEKNSRFDEWQSNFIGEAATLLGTWGISPTNPDWVAVTDGASNWNTAWAAAHPLLASRTHPLVKGMQATRDEYEKSLRYFVQNYLARNKKVTNSQRATVRITIRKNTRTYHSVPMDRVPDCSVHKFGHVFHELRITDPATPTTKRKPAGVKRILVYMAITEQGVAPAASDFKFIGSTSTYKYSVSYSVSQEGKRAHFYVMWEDSRQKKSQPSLIVSRTIM